jgi:hypothetical protein
MSLLSTKYARQKMKRDVSYAEVLGQKLTEKLIAYLCVLPLKTEYSLEAKEQIVRKFFLTTKIKGIDHAGITFGKIKQADPEIGLNLLGTL